MVTAAGEVQTPEVAINFGNLIAVVLDFLIIAFVIFCMIKAINRLHRKAEGPPRSLLPEPSAEEKLLTEIRDLLKGARCQRKDLTRRSRRRRAIFPPPR